MEAIYFFQINKDGKPGIPTAHNVCLDGLMTDDIATNYHLRMLAQQFAKLLNSFSTQPVRYWMKGDEHNAMTIDTYNEQENSKDNTGDSANRKEQKNDVVS